MHAKPKDWTQSRWHKFKDAAGREPDLPPVDAGGYLLSALIEMGFAASTQSGFLPLSWQEIDAYSRLTGALSEGWEARIIRSMSSEYIEGRQIGMDDFGRAPWEPVNG